MNNIGDRIKILRKEFNITQKELAQDLGVTNAHISKIEKGLTTPSEALIKLIAKIYEVSEYWIKTGEGPMMLIDVLINSDHNMEYSASEFNKLLRDKNPIIRLKASQLDVIFHEITIIEFLDESDKILYLDTVIKLFGEINDLMKTFKQYAYDNQLSLIFSDLDKVLDYQLNNIILQFKGLKEFFIKSRNEVELSRKSKGENKTS